MKLYGSLASPYVARVVLAARLKGVALPLEQAPGGLKSPQYLAMNPLGKMPTLEHDGRFLYESTVVCEYLDEACPGPALLPAAAWDRAQARLTMRLLDLYVGPESGVLFRNLNPAQRDAAAVEAARGKLAQYFGVLDARVAAAAAAGGPATLADCALLPTLLLLRQAVLPAYGIADPLATLPGFGAWFARLAAAEPFAAFLPEYAAAVDGFMKWVAAGRPGG